MHSVRPLRRLAGLNGRRSVPLVPSHGLQTHAEPSSNPLSVDELLKEGRAANLAAWPAHNSAVRFPSFQ